MKLTILDAIERYKAIHSAFCAGGSEEDARSALDVLKIDCEAAELVFAPKVSDLYEHSEFETYNVNDEESSEWEDEESSEYA